MTLGILLSYSFAKEMSAIFCGCRFHELFSFPPCGSLPSEFYIDISGTDNFSSFTFMDTKYDLDGYNISSIVYR